MLSTTSLAKKALAGLMLGALVLPSIAPAQAWDEALPALIGREVVRGGTSVEQSTAGAAGAAVTDQTTPVLQAEVAALAAEVRVAKDKKTRLQNRKSELEGEITGVGRAAADVIVRENLLAELREYNAPEGPKSVLQANNELQTAITQYEDAKRRLKDAKRAVPQSPLGPEYTKLGATPQERNAALGLITNELATKNTALKSSNARAEQLLTEDLEAE